MSQRGAERPNPRAAPLPMADQRLLLDAALLRGAEAHSAWVQWRRAGGDVNTIGPASFRLLPLLYRNLEANRVDDPDLPRLKGVYRHTWVVNQGVARRLGLALEALQREGIVTMTLGGTAVSVVHYRDAGTRRMDDVAVLVSPVDAHHALTVLRAGGWSPLQRVDAGRVLRSSHSMPLLQPDGTRMQLQWRAFPESISDADFWSGAVAATIGGAETLAPGPTEQLLHACACGVRAGPAALMWIADAAMILRTAEKEIDWSRLVDGAGQRELALTTGAALALLQELAHEPIPDLVLAELGARPSRLRERLLLLLSRRPGAVLGSVQLWDLYRRRVAEDGYAYPDFLKFVADAKGLPSRRAIAPKLARRAVSLTATVLPARRQAKPGRQPIDLDGAPPI